MSWWNYMDRERKKNWRRSKKIKRQKTWQFKSRKIVIEAAGFFLAEALSKASQKLEKMKEAGLAKANAEISHFRERSLSLNHFRTKYKSDVRWTKTSEVM